jgi:hypothetical protein
MDMYSRMLLQVMWADSTMRLPASCHTWNSWTPSTPFTCTTQGNKWTIRYKHNAITKCYAGPCISMSTAYTTSNNSTTQGNNSTLGWGFGLVVRAAGWHAGDPGSILGRDGLHTFGRIPQRCEHSWDGYVRYTKFLISFKIKLRWSWTAHNGLECNVH